MLKRLSTTNAIANGPANGRDGHARLPHLEYLKDYRDLVMWGGHAGVLNSNAIKSLLIDGGQLNPLRAVLRRFDDWLSRQYSVKEFSRDPKCVLRIQIGPIRHTVDLPDGTIVDGSQTLMIHWWNERASIIPAEGPTLAWALETSRSMRYSLRLIARYLQDNSTCTEIQTVGGNHCARRPSKG